MSKKGHANPYREGTQYNQLFAFWQKKQIVTKPKLIAEAQKLGLSEAAAKATAVVLLSPRSESKRGDCRGNMSAAGHLYFAERFSRNEEGEYRFRLRWRKEALAPLKRGMVSGKVEAEKTKVSDGATVTDGVTA